MTKNGFSRNLATAAITLFLGVPVLAQQPVENPAEEKCSFKMYKGNEVDRKVKIQNKPEPEYTEEDRRGHASGEIILTAVFCGSGEVLQIKVKSGLSDTLNARAIEAARKIRFTPAEKDGEKVSQWLILKYIVDL